MHVVDYLISQRFVPLSYVSVYLFNNLQENWEVGCFRKTYPLGFKQKQALRQPFGLLSTAQLTPFMTPFLVFCRDLLRIGVTLAGHQKKILNSVQSMRVQMSQSPTSMAWRSMSSCSNGNKRDGQERVGCGRGGSADKTVRRLQMLDYCLSTFKGHRVRGTCFEVATSVSCQQKHTYQCHGKQHINTYKYVQTIYLKTVKTNQCVLGEKRDFNPTTSEQ